MKIGKTIRKYRKEKGLTQEEINDIVLEAENRFKTQDYAEVFLWIKSKLEAYPNCLKLIWQLSTILDAQRLFKPIPDDSSYDAYILNCYNRVLQSEEEAGSGFPFFLLFAQGAV